MRLSRLHSSCNALTVALFLVAAVLGLLLNETKQQLKFQQAESARLQGDFHLLKQNEADLQQEAARVAESNAHYKAELISCQTQLAQTQKRLHANLKIETDFHRFNPQVDSAILKLDDQPLLPPAVPAHHPPRLAILVPFRKADQELKQFIPHMDAYLQQQGISYTIYILNQVDSYRFNRGLLLDAGFLLVEQSSDYIALHDVDLLPINSKLSYSFPAYPFHVSAPWLHPNYNYKTFIGGILLLANEHFRLVNGMSANYWGWGREDDELYKRIIELGLKVDRPPVDIGTGTSNTFIHLHDADKRPRDMMKVGAQYKQGKERDSSTGIQTAQDQFTVLRTREELVGKVPYTVFDLELKCNTETTPWCLEPTECKAGYFQKPIKDDPDHRWLCTRCGTKCWKGFVLVGKCTQTESPVCMKVGRDISPEEAIKWPAGDIEPQ
eukprot:m.53432 g.53432  ORF g.53432 m.53432 type:complete len:439 (+) comp13562_c0_seq2:71-1387(+)